MDLYAVGIVLFEMLTGKAPFESKATDPALYWVEMREMHQSEPLPSLAPLGVPESVERVALRATAKRLEDRYQSAEEMLEDLRRISGSTAADAATVVLSNSRLHLTTTPAGAEVYVDDSLRETPDAIRGKLVVDGLTAGLHRVRVVKEGFNEYRINVALEEGRQTDLQVAIPARATVAIPTAENTAAGGLETLNFRARTRYQNSGACRRKPSSRKHAVYWLPASRTRGRRWQCYGKPKAWVAVDSRYGAFRRKRDSSGFSNASRNRLAQDDGYTAYASYCSWRGSGSGSFCTIGTRKTTGRGGSRDHVIGACSGSLFRLERSGSFSIGLRVRIPGAAVPTATPPQQSTSATQPGTQPESQPAVDDKKRAAEARRQAEQDAEALEAQKKAAEAQKKETKSLHLGRRLLPRHLYRPRLNRPKTHRPNQDATRASWLQS